MSKHYIRVSNGNVIQGFSDAFQLPVEGDICINTGESRHFQIDNIINPELINEKGIYLYKYIDNKIVLKNEQEILADESSIVPTVSLLDTHLQNLEQSVTELTQLISMLMGGM